MFLIQVELEGSELTCCGVVVCHISLRPGDRIVGVQPGAQHLLPVSPLPPVYSWHLSLVCVSGNVT